jgi:pyridoxal phosphate enzyme (YggS family)
MRTIAENLAKLRERIRQAADSAGRDPAEITLVAVAKTFPRSAVEEALAAGQTVFGENRVQEALEKYEPPLPGTELHMVGHLQSNKARPAAALFDRIHSIDSLKAARRLDHYLEQAGRKMKALVQVNLGLEPQKSGAEEREVAALLYALSEIPNLVVDGLMVLPPFFDNPRKTIPYFRRLRELRDRLNDADIGGITLRHLSMGMTADFPEAIAEGATMIRIGTAVFGRRNGRN